MDQSDITSTLAPVDAGVPTCIVGGLKKEEVKSILELCISRVTRSVAFRPNSTGQECPGRMQGDRSREWSSPESAPIEEEACGLRKTSS